MFSGRIEIEYLRNRMLTHAGAVADYRHAPSEFPFLFNDEQRLRLGSLLAAS